MSRCPGRRTIKHLRIIPVFNGDFSCYNHLMDRSNFFFYDLETSGLSAREDRIMQFAGQRTDMNFRPIGKPVNLLVKLSDDTLPSPSAIMTTGITPQKTQEEGITEAELCRILQEEIFTPGTISLGYNSIRFDDEFMRHLFWRNFYDPYEWQWRENRSRWDMLDVVRMTRALRPESINWPVREDGKPTNRLELITKENGISHEAAHDALSDVTALIDVSKLIKDKQPQLFDYLFKMRKKPNLKKLVNLENPQPFVYSSGHYDVGTLHTTVVFPLAPSKNGNILVYDLRYNLEELERGGTTGGTPAGEPHASTEGETVVTGPRDNFFPIVKELAYNKCPAVAPISVLDAADGWQKIGLAKETVDKNLKTLLAHPEFAEKMRTHDEDRPEYEPPVDVESALYSSFVPELDKVRCNAVRKSDADGLADFHPNFVDERLPELLLHYKAKNFPTALSEAEASEWEKYRRARLEREVPKFLAEMEKFEKAGADAFLLEELKLWYQNLSE